MLGDEHGTTSICDSELDVDVAQVRLDGVHADHVARGDIGDTLENGQLEEDFVFAWGEILDGSSVCMGGRKLCLRGLDDGCSDCVQVTESAVLFFQHGGSFAVSGQEGTP